MNRSLHRTSQGGQLDQSPQRHVQFSVGSSHRGPAVQSTHIRSITSASSMTSLSRTPLSGRSGNMGHGVAGIGSTMRAVANHSHSHPRRCARAPTMTLSQHRQLSSSSSSNDSTEDVVELNAHVIRAENPTKPPLVILHGLLGHLGNWRMIASRPQLNSDRDIITVDLRNHGSSPHTTHMSYTSMADDIAHLIQQYSPNQPVTLIGHSMGGKVTAATALRHPHLLAAAVLVDILPINYSEQDMEDIKDILHSVQRADLSNGATRPNIMDQLAKTIPNLGIRQWLSTNLIGQDPGPDGAILRWKPNINALVDNYATIRGFDVENALPYHGPALLLIGGASGFADGQTALDTLATTLPECELRVVQGAGHWLHAEKPEEFTKELLGFLNTHHL